MKKQGGITQRISGIVLSVLKLNNDSDSGMEGKDDKPLAGLLQELYDGMVDAKNSVTYSMAMVAMKRKRLREMVEKQDGIKAQAKHFEGQGKSEMAKRLLGQVLVMDESIALAANELEAMDAQAKTEIVHFKELERKAEVYETKIQAAEQLERFNKLREQVSSTVTEFDTSVLSQMDRRIEKIELKSAQLAAGAALNAEAVEDMILDQEVQYSLAEEKLDKEFALLQAEVKAGSKELPTAETMILLEHKPADRARDLLGKPAFDGILVPRGRG